MQVAVAFAHPAGGAARGHQRRQAPALGLAPVRQPLQRAGQRGARAQRRQGGKVVVRQPRQIGRMAPGAVGRCLCGLGLEGGHRTRQGVDLGGPQGAARGALGQQGAGRKAAHVHGPFDRLRGIATQARRRRRAGDRQHLQVQLGRAAAVDAQLLLAGGAALRQGAEVQEVQRQRLLDLVGMLARQQQPGNVGFEALHVGRAAGPQVVLQLGDQAGAGGGRGGAHEAWRRVTAWPAPGAESDRTARAARARRIHRACAPARSSPARTGWPGCRPGQTGRPRCHRPPCAPPGPA